MNLSEMLSNLFTAQGLVSLLTLSLLEIVLGVDNIIFIAITADKLPANQRNQARTTGLLLAVIIRIGLLFTLSYLSSQESSLFEIGGHGITLRDIIFFGGGIFLLYKTWGELWEKINGGGEENHSRNIKKVNVSSIIFQIILIDIVFSFDSILTAVVISKNILIMSGAVVIAMIVMIAFSGIVAEFINRNPAIKTLALSFLLLIGVLLIVESVKTFTGFEIDKSYVYAALAFSLFVELLNMWERKRLKQK